MRKWEGKEGKTYIDDPSVGQTPCIRVRER